MQNNKENSLNKFKKKLFYLFFVPFSMKIILQKKNSQKKYLINLIN